MIPTFGIMPTAFEWFAILSDFASGRWEVHAGVHPEHYFTWKDIEGLTTIREPFLSGANWQHAFVAVQGHTFCGPM